MRFISRSMLAAAVAVGLCNCSTIIHSPSQKIPVNSTPAQASVTVTNAKGKVVATGTTPTTISVRRGAGYFKPGNYVATIEKPGYETEKVSIGEGHPNGAYYVNILTTPLTGALLLDPATGAMYTLSPEKIDVTLKPKGR